MLLFISKVFMRASPLGYCPAAHTPNNGNFEFTVTNNNLSRTTLHVEILDVQGKKYYSESFIIENEHPVNINRSDLPKGFYILKISNGEYMANKKLVVK